MAESPLPRRTPSLASRGGEPAASPSQSASSSRHLKRLSLSASSSSLSSQSSSLASPTALRSITLSNGQHHRQYNGTSAAQSPHTPHRVVKLNGQPSQAQGHGPVHGVGHCQARSLSSHPSESDEDDPHQDPDPDLTPQASASTSNPNGSTTTQTTTASWDFPSPVSTSSTSAPSSAHAPRVGSHRSRAGTHPRRGTSISYSSSSALIASDPHNSPGSGYSNLPGLPNSFSRHGLGSSSRSAGQGLGIGLGLSSVEMDETSESEMDDNASSIASTSPQRSRRERPSSSFLSPTRSASAITGSTRPTLTEQNADLLSFIAKKERKCLDLREELKRHESELKTLKSKWETIVARSLHSPTAPSSSMFPSRSPNPSDSPIPRATPHALDLHLLASTFDPTGTEFSSDPGLSISSTASSSTSHSSTSGVGTPDMGESVQAAKAWVGGVFGKVMGAVDETLMTVVGAHPTPISPEIKALESLKEEDEGVEIREQDPREHTRRSSSIASFEDPLSSSSPTKTRPRTTLDVLSTGWGNVSKRLSTVTLSETYQSSKKAASGFVDSFEQGLATALGPLDLPPIPPSEGGEGGDAEQGQRGPAMMGYRRPSKVNKEHPRALKESSKGNVMTTGVIEEEREAEVEAEGKGQQ